MGKEKVVTAQKVRLGGKFVHGGQMLAEDQDGKKLFVWGGLPGELVDVRITKKKSSYREGIVEHVHERSNDRINPAEPESYLSTSPWQIVDYAAELRYKDDILKETFERESLDLKWEKFVSAVAPASGRAAHARIYSEPGALRNPEGVSHYRNKMEYGFWGDDDGLHFAHFVRGTHGKQIVSPYSSLPNDDVMANSAHMLEDLRRLNVRAGDLKTLIIRAAQDHTTAFALFVKNKDIDFSLFKDHPPNLDIYYSDPRSPASVQTEKLHSFGNTTLTDTLLGVDISYDVTSFFQVNVRIFEKVLSKISELIGNAPAVDFYSGVGAIGIPVNARVLVESDPGNIAMAKRNVGSRSIEVVHAPSEQAITHITHKDILIVDPPRAGLHKKVIERILEAKPPQIIYLSCNPATQARDVALLQKEYTIQSAQGYNFFPRTPHVESLVVMSRV